jgi:hypothetical protein
MSTLKRLVIVALTALALVLPAQVGTANAGQIGCKSPTYHRVVCWDYAAFPVRMKVTVRFYNGSYRIFYFNLASGQRTSRYFVPNVKYVSWRWWEL